MAIPTFPELSVVFDSASYSESKKDPTMRHDVEGGYSITRPRYTRIPGSMTISVESHDTVPGY